MIKLVEMLHYTNTKQQHQNLLQHKLLAREARTDKVWSRRNNSHFHSLFLGSSHGCFLFRCCCSRSFPACRLVFAHFCFLRPGTRGPRPIETQLRMLESLLCFCPPALHPRCASMLGDSAKLHFFPESVVSSQCALQHVPKESVDRCYVELPDASASVHESFLPEVMRVLKKGAKVCIRHREGTKWADLLIFG